MIRPGINSEVKKKNKKEVMLGVIPSFHERILSVPLLE